jgi:hypothetical protein
MENDPFVDSYEDLPPQHNAPTFPSNFSDDEIDVVLEDEVESRFARSNNPQNVVICWVCGEINAAHPGPCSMCSEYPLSEVEAGANSSSEDGMLSPVRVRNSCSDLPPRKPLPVVSASYSPSLRGPSGRAPAKSSVECELPNVASSAPASSGPLKSPRNPMSQSVSPRRPSSPRQRKRTVKTPSGAQTPDFDMIKRDDSSLSGWLYKQKAQGRVNVLDGGWKARFVQVRFFLLFWNCFEDFILRLKKWDSKKNRLYYYHYEGEENFANFVSFDSKTVVLGSDACPEASLAGCSFQVTASYTHRPYVFCCGSEEVKISFLLLFAQTEQNKDLCGVGAGAVGVRLSGGASGRRRRTNNRRCLEIVRDVKKEK